MKKNLSLLLLALLVSLSPLLAQAQPGSAAREAFHTGFDNKLRPLAAWQDQGSVFNFAVRDDRLVVSRQLDFEADAQVLSLHSIKDGRLIAQTKLSQGEGLGSWTAGFLMDGQVYALRENGGRLLVFDEDLQNRQEVSLPPFPPDTLLRMDQTGLGIYAAQLSAKLWRYDFATNERQDYPTGLPAQWMVMDLLTRQTQGMEVIFMDRQGLSIHFASKAKGSQRLSPLPRGFDWHPGGAVFMIFGQRALWGSLPFDGQLTEISAWQEYEFPMDVKGDLLLTACLYPDAVFRLYDLRQGSLINTLSLKTQDMALVFEQAQFAGDREVILHIYDIEQGQYGLYLWNFLQDSHPVQEGIRCTTLSAVREENDRHAASVARKYGIDLYTRQEGARFESEVYTGVPFEHELVLSYAISEVDRFFGSLPPGMTKELLVPPYRRLSLYLCGPIRPKTPTGIASAAGLSSDHGTQRYIALDAQDIGFQSNFAHEFMHLMEDRMWLMEDGSAPGILSAWDRLTTSALPDRGYHYSYHDPQGAELLDTRFTADQYAWDGNQEQTWFIDAYSRTFPMEDRARLFEHLFVGDAYASTLFSFPHLKTKAQALNAAIRHAFVSVQKVSSAVWERMVPQISHQQALRMVWADR